MPCYMLQVEYTREGWAAILDNPHGHWDTVTILVGKLGGKLESSWLALGECRGLAICQMPRDVGAAALSMAASMDAAVRSATATPLVGAEDAVELLTSRPAPAGLRSVGITVTKRTRSEEEIERDDTDGPWRTPRRAVG